MLFCPGVLAQQIDEELGTVGGCSKGTELALPWGLYPHPVGSDSPYTSHSPAPPASYWDLAQMEE